jgi:hypothetical protein
MLYIINLFFLILIWLLYIKFLHKEEDNDKNYCNQCKNNYKKCSCCVCYECLEYTFNCECPKCIKCTQSIYDCECKLKSQ